MGFLDRLLGREPREPRAQHEPQHTPFAPHRPQEQAATTEDQRAVARYRYLLRTAPPEALEQVHAEAFSRLTPEQRSQVLAELSRDLPPGEQVPTSDAQSLARTATRAEMRQPGYLERAFSRGRFGAGPGMGMGGVVMGSMMGTIAGVVVGSAVADALFDGYGDSPEAAAAEEAGAAETGGDQAASDAGSDLGGGYDGGGGSDFGGGFGDFSGGDFGGGEF
jgi:hypothetical protein